MRPLYRAKTITIKLDTFKHFAETIHQYHALLRHDVIVFCCIFCCLLISEFCILNSFLAQTESFSESFFNFRLFVLYYMLFTEKQLLKDLFLNCSEKFRSKTSQLMHMCGCSFI